MWIWYHILTKSIKVLGSYVFIIYIAFNLSIIFCCITSLPIYYWQLKFPTISHVWVLITIPFIQPSFFIIPLQHSPTFYSPLIVLWIPYTKLVQLGSMVWESMKNLNALLVYHSPQIWLHCYKDHEETWLFLALRNLDEVSIFILFAETCTTTKVVLYSDY